MPIYIYILCTTTYFVTFPEVSIEKCSGKYLFLKYRRKVRAGFLEILETAIFFHGFAHVNGWFFKTLLQTYSEICIFCSSIQYIVSKKQAVGSAHELSTDSSESSLMKLIRHTFLPKWVVCPPFPQAEQLPKLFSSRHIRNSLSVYLFLNSEP